MLGRSGDPRREQRGGRLEHLRAPPVPDRDHAALLQRVQPLAHREPADAEELRELALRRQVGARREAAALDVAEELAHDVLVELLADDRLKHGSMVN